jgi:tetratricopeptide (TPR) repeat protein
MSQQVSDLIQQGKEYGHRRDPESALACFNQAIQLEPDNPQAYYFRGLIYLQIKKDYPRALADLDIVLRLKPDVNEAYLWRGVAHRELSQTPEAVADFEYFIRVRRDHPQVPQILTYLAQAKAPQSPAQEWIVKGDMMMQLGDAANLALALQFYTKAIQADSKWVEAYRKRVACRQQLKQMGDSLDDYSQIIKLDPNDATAYAERAELYLAKKDPKRALNDIEKALVLNPQNAHYYMIQGQILAIKGNLREAVIAFTRSIQLGNDEARPFRGNVILEKKVESQDDVQMVRDDFNHILSLYPDHPNREKMQGILRRMDQIEQQSIRMASTMPAELLISEGVRYAQMGNTQNAIQNFTEAIRQNPKLAEAYNNRGAVYNKTRDFDRAIEDFTRAIKLKADYYEAYIARGQAQQAKGNLRAASEDFNYVIQHAPKNNTVYQYAVTQSQQVPQPH